MAMMRFDLKTLETLDGRIAAAFQRAVSSCVVDCQERPGDKNVRKVTLEMELKPVAVGDDGGCSHVDCEFRVKAKVPERRSRPFTMLAQPKGGLLFSEENPGNVDQTTIDEMDSEGRVHRSKPPEERN